MVVAAEGYTNLTEHIWRYGRSQPATGYERLYEPLTKRTAAPELSSPLVYVTWGDIASTA